MFFTDANKPLNTVQYATTPRYLAGGGDPRRITEVLRAAGWTSHSDPAYPHVLLASPGMAVRLTLEPAPDAYSAWWRFHDHAGGWYAHFGGHTPVEIIAGFSDALTRPAPQKPPSLPEIRDVLVSTGWSRSYDRKGIESAHSPDRYVRMGPHPGLDGQEDWPTWCAEAALTTGLGGHERLWQAWFSHGTPTHLVAGFAAQLVAPGPVYRGSYGLPCSWLVAQEPTAVQGEQLAAEHRQRLKAVRASARTQRPHRTHAAGRASPGICPALNPTPHALPVPAPEGPLLSSTPQPTSSSWTGSPSTPAPPPTSSRHGTTTPTNTSTNKAGPWTRPPTAAASAGATRTPGAPSNPSART